MRSRTIIAAAVLGAVALSLLGCEGGFRDELEFELAGIKADREFLAERTDEAIEQLAALREAAENADGALAGETATIAANLEATAAEGREILETLDDAIEDLETRLAQVPSYGDNVSQTIAEGAAVAESIAPFLPTPIGEILGLVGLAGGTYVGTRERRRRRRAELESEVAVEAVRDTHRGFDRWFEKAAGNGDREAALEAREAIRGRLSDRTRPLVARVAEHPLAAEG